MSRLIRTTAALLATLPELERASLLAVDTEFHSERWFYPRLMLLQLRADRGEPILIDALAVPLEPLAHVLTSRPLVLHGGQQDIQILHRWLGVVPNVILDTQVAAGFAGVGYPVGLGTLVQRFLGVTMEKGETLSDWSRRPLTDAQLGYAAEDVLILADLFDAIVAEVGQRGHTVAAQSAVAELVARATTPADDSRAWERVGGAQLLADDERACLRSLVAWRDREARERDVPKNGLAGDAILFDLARRRPANANEMRANRKMPGHLSRQEADAILGILADPGPPPRALRKERGAQDVLRAVARVAERRTGVAAELLLPDGDVVRVLSEGPDALAPWRRDLLGAEFEAFVAGSDGFNIPAGFLRGP